MALGEHPGSDSVGPLGGEFFGLRLKGTSFIEVLIDAVSHAYIYEDKCAYQCRVCIYKDKYTYTRICEHVQPGCIWEKTRHSQYCRPARPAVKTKTVLAENHTSRRPVGLKRRVLSRARVTLLQPPRRRPFARYICGRCFTFTQTPPLHFYTDAHCSSERTRTPLC